MGTIDIIILIILAIGFVRGLKNGFARELGGILGIILGIYLAMNFSYLDYLLSSFVVILRNLMLTLISKRLT